MPQTISFSIGAQVAPVTNVAQTLTLDACDKIDVTIPAAAGGAAGTATVQVQPGTAVKLLLVTASKYDAALTYKVDGGGTSFALDAPLLLVGAGAVSMLGATQKAFAFSNAIAPAAAVAVTIIVGRKAL